MSSRHVQNTQSTTMMYAMQRGQAAIQSQNLPEAERWFRQAVEEVPKDSQAKACLGQTLCWLGRRKEGLNFLRDAGESIAKKARKSRDIGLLLGLAEQLQFWNDWQGAAELLGHAVEIKPSEVRAFQLLALTKSRLNQPKSALSAARQAAKLAPHSAMLQILLATLEAGDKQHESARRRLEAVLQGYTTDEERFRAHKELAAILDKQGQYDQVFPHLHAAATASGGLAEVCKQDARLVPQMLEVNRAEFDRELLGRWAGQPFPGPRPPLFIAGFMRSGTTLTQEVLGAHPEVFIADETDLVMRMARELERRVGPAAHQPERLRRLTRDDVLALRAFYWEQLRNRFGGDIGERLVVDKTTMNTIDLGLINCIFPDAKLIFVVRDPRDTCLSGFMQVMLPTPSTVHLFTWLGTARFYAQVMTYWFALRDRLTMDFIELRYEDAVSSFEATFKHVFEFAGLGWHSGVAEFHKRAAGRYIASPSYSQVAQPLYASSVGRWRRYAQEFEPVAELLQPFVDALGYEP